MKLTKNSCLERLMILIIVTFMPFNAVALSLEFPIDQLLDSASDVATVDIVEGQVIERHGKNCGIIYRARVIESLKGASDTIVTFGNEEGLEVGKRYLVVLVKKKAYIEDREWLFQTTRHNFASEAKADEAFRSWKSCHGSIPQRMVAAYGLAAMAIELPPELGYRTPAVKVSLTIWLPPLTKCTKATSVNSHDEGKWVVWITQQEMRRVLGDVLARPEGTKIVGGPGKYAISPSDCDEPVKRF